MSYDDGEKPRNLASRTEFFGTRVHGCLNPIQPGLPREKQGRTGSVHSPRSESRISHSYPLVYDSLAVLLSCETAAGNRGVLNHTLGARCLYQIPSLISHPLCSTSHWPRISIRSVIPVVSAGLFTLRFDDASNSHMAYICSGSRT
jgi:hypothetical protein